MMRTMAMIAASAALAACTTSPTADDGDLLGFMDGSDPAEAARIAQRVSIHPLGSDKNPVRADMPRGQRAYLARLRCQDGTAPAFERVGSMGMSPYGGVVDGYEVICAGGKPQTALIHIDMYHPGHVEQNAPPGFVIVP